MAFQIGDKYYHEDIESGHISQVSKQTYDFLNGFSDAFKAMREKGSELKGRIQFHSTMADETNNGDFSDLWQQQPWLKKEKE